MVQQPNQLLHELTTALGRLQERDFPSLKSIETAIRLVQEAISELKAYLDGHEFTSERETIYFYKHIKPDFDFRLIYYLRLLCIEQGVPIAGKEHRRAYYHQEQGRLQAFYQQHAEFIRYYRLDATHLDGYYFKPPAGQDYSFPGQEFLVYAGRYNAPMSYTLAAIKAFDQLQVDLERALWWLDQEPSGLTTNPPAETALIWTAPKVAFVELIYALHASGVFNNGGAELRALIDHFCSYFHVRFANIYKVFEEIRLRKKSRTVFLDALQTNLLSRMDQDDQKAL